MKAVAVPLLLVLSSMLMAFAWIGHLRFRTWSFGFALLVSWLLVFPEYILNIFATRWGRDVYTGGQMAAFNLCSGVFCVALVSHFYLGESITRLQACGFALMAVAIILITGPKPEHVSESEALSERNKRQQLVEETAPVR